MRSAPTRRRDAATDAPDSRRRIPVDFEIRSIGQPIPNGHKERMTSRFRLLALVAVATILAAGLAGVHAASDPAAGDTKHAAKPAKPSKTTAAKPGKTKSAKTGKRGKKTATKPTGKSHAAKPE